MIFCAKCKRELTAKKNGIILRWGVGHCYAGDLFECPECEAQVVVTGRESFFSVNVDPSVLIQMDE